MKTPKLFLALFILTLYAILILQKSYAQSQEILLVDNFESYPINNLNPTAIGISGFNANQGDISLAAIQGRDAFCHSGISLQVGYDVSPNDTSFCGFVSLLHDSDLSGYNYLSFWIRSELEADYLFLELKHVDGTNAKVALWDYLPCGPSYQWQKVVIPLDAFWNLTDLSQMTELLITFDNYSINLNGAPKAGEIHVDEILFGSFFPGYVKLDHFNDSLYTNTVGGNIGIFEEDTMTSKDDYSTVIHCPNGDKCACDLKIEYNNTNDDFGGVFFVLGGGVDGWQKIPRQLANSYDNLHLTLIAEGPSTNPQIVKVELKSETPANQNLIHFKHLLGITTVEQSYTIPFSGFSPQITNQPIKEFAIVFEQPLQTNSSGVLHVDDIEFRAAFFTGEDTLTPIRPINLVVDGIPPAPLLQWQAGSTHSISADIDSSNSRLESVRLEYQPTPCGDSWICIGKTFAPVLSSVDFTVPSNVLPQSTEVMIRMVVENYQGTSGISDTIYVRVAGDVIPLDSLWKEGFALFEMLRASTGVYLDAVRFQPPQNHPSSVATTGMGMVILCIADSLNLIHNAEELALETLKSINGLTNGFTPERNTKGWFRHFIDENTGEVAWNSEFSSIDTGILTAGALFCKKYFGSNDSIALLADQLYTSIDWASMIADPITGGIYRVSDSLGAGSANDITLPFNEYMIVAWLAKHYDPNNVSATTLWNNFYEHPDSLPISTYMNIEVLTDFPDNFLSGFVPQFNYYLCNHFTTQPSYLDFFEHAMMVDQQWWKDSGNVTCQIWGFGAGSSSGWVPSGYHPDDVINHPGQISSPHIIAGFIPVLPDAAVDITYLYYNVPEAKYVLPSPTNSPILWRFSTQSQLWKADDIQGIDFSTFLLGLAAHPNLLGPGFFEMFNDFDFPSEMVPVSSPEEVLRQFVLYQNVPNPFGLQTKIPFEIYRPARINLNIYNNHGLKIRSYNSPLLSTGKHNYLWDGRNSTGRLVPPGFYHYQIESDGKSQTKTMILNKQ